MNDGAIAEEFRLEVMTKIKYDDNRKGTDYSILNDACYAYR
jgi:hypothetical protein